MNASMQRSLATYLLEHDRMIVEPTEEMMRLFPLASDEAAWLEAAASLLGGAVELRRPVLPGAKIRLAIKDRSTLFLYTQDRTLEAMARDRKASENA